MDTQGHQFLGNVALTSSILVSRLMPFRMVTQGQALVPERPLLVILGTSQTLPAARIQKEKAFYRYPLAKQY